MVDPKATYLSQHLSNLPKLDKTHFVSAFVRDQSFHAKSYVLEGHAAVSHWDRVVSLADEAQARDAFGTPVLKPRVPTKIILEPVRRTPLKDYKNGPPRALAEDRLSHPAQNENKRKRPGPSVEKHSGPKSNPQGCTSNNQPPFKIPDSDIDGVDDQAWLRRERRERKRAKRAIINPTGSSDIGNETVSHAKARRKAKNNNSRANIPAGFALMHGFTATNVGASRLTIKPSASIGVFNKGKASARTRANPKSAKKGRRSTGFSELGFLNNRDNEQHRSSEKFVPIRQLSNIGSDQSPEKQPKKFIITNRRHLKVRPSETKNRTLRSFPGKENQSVTSVDGLSTSHPIKASSSPNLLLKANSVGSTVWDIEAETASILSPALPRQNRSVVLEICNRPWNDSPGDQGAEFDDSHHEIVPRPETLAEKSDNLIVDVKSPSPSLGPSQSASQHCRSYPHTNGTIPRADANSKYFLTQNSHAEHQIPPENQPFNLVTDFLPEQTEKMMSASCLEVISAHNGPSHQGGHAGASNLAKYLDTQVTQHLPEITPCLQLSATEPQLAFSLPMFDVSVQGVGPDNHLDSELVDPDRGYTTWQDSECSVKYYAQDTHLWLSVDYGDDLYVLGHHGRDVPEDNVPCYSHTVYDACEDYLCNDDRRSEERNVTVQEYDLTRDSGGEHSDEYMIEPALAFSDKEEHELVEGHILCRSLYLDSDDEGEYVAEIFGNEHETLELDDAWDQFCGDPHNDESQMLLSRSLASTSSSELDGSFLSDPEPIHPAAMFSQGRALLVGTTSREDRNANTGAHTRQPLLSLVEADVAKSLRNHWLPQKL